MAGETLAERGKRNRSEWSSHKASRHKGLCQCASLGLSANIRPEAVLLLLDQLWTATTNPARLLSSAPTMLLLGQSNLARLVVVSMAILLVGQLFLFQVGEGAGFELACMDKCSKTRRCKKIGRLTLDVDCDRQCKKKCYKVQYLTFPLLLLLLPHSLTHSLSP